MDEAGQYGIADGIQAVKVVREHAREWGISQDRVGFMGFSAGGMVASAALLQKDAAARQLCCSNLWCTVWRNTCYSARTSAYFLGLGARRPGGTRFREQIL